AKVELGVPFDNVERLADAAWKKLVDERVEMMTRAAHPQAADGDKTRLYGPEDDLPAAANELVEATLEKAAALSFDDYRYLVELALPRAARRGDAERALALRVLTELRKRLVFAGLGGKALSSMEYLTDGGRDPLGRAEGGIYRLLDDVPPLFEAHGAARHLRITYDTRDDLVAPADAARDVLVIDFAG